MNVAILGYGVVGSGVAKVLKENAKTITEKTGYSFKVTRILDKREFPLSEYRAIITNNFDDIANDSSIDVVVETMGGVEPAYSFVKTCLEKGKHVVSSNKELVAVKGAELLKIAESKNVNFFFEASVGGGIPVIRPISRCLAGNNIRSVAGILNGTTNYILTKMITEGVSFEEALSEAQKLGYAEKDPTADVDGYDAMRKICILASLCFGVHLYPDNVYCEGIRRITLADVAYAEKFGSVIKLVARAEKLDNGEVFAMVSPCLVKKTNMLAGVKDVYNACLVNGDMTGDVLMYGKGAGSEATASAVVGDIIDCADNSKERKFFGWQDTKQDILSDYSLKETSLYVRCLVMNKPEACRRLKAIFGNVVFLWRKNQPENEIAFITPVMKEKQLRKVLSTTGVNVITTIRVLA
ncbi:MAG: homoserine dehydrogenase [Clostridia bacterium]|nr:homoserine dehydrogenase [Clostridia bacterium]